MRNPSENTDYGKQEFDGGELIDIDEGEESDEEFLEDLDSSFDDAEE